MRGSVWPNGLGFDLSGYRFGAWICREKNPGHCVKWDGSEGGDQFRALLTVNDCGEICHGEGTSPAEALAAAKRLANAVRSAAAVRRYREEWSR